MARPKKTDKAPKPAKAPKAEKPPKAEKATEKTLRFNSEVNDEEMALFLLRLPKIHKLKELLATANSNLRNEYKAAKAEAGFEKADFDIAFALETPEKEAKTKARIARELTIAKFVGSDLGAQLDMFLEPIRVPAIDRAADEGKRDAMAHATASPKYDPSTPQYKSYLDAYHEVQAKQVAGGIGKLEPKEDAPRLIPKADKTPKPVAVPVPAPKPAPSSGMAMTRADFERQKQKAAADAAFKTAGPEQVEPTAESAFKKRVPAG